MEAPRSFNASSGPVEAMEILFDAPSGVKELGVRSDYLDFLKDSPDRPFPWQMPYEERRRTCSSPRTIQQVIMDEQWNESVMRGFWKRLRRYCIPREDWQLTRDLFDMFLSEIGIPHHALQEKLFQCFQFTQECNSCISRGATSWDDAARISQMRYECGSTSHQVNDTNNIGCDFSLFGKESPAPGITLTLLSGTVSRTPVAVVGEVSATATAAAASTTATAAAATKEGDALNRKTVPSVNALHMCKILEGSLSGPNREKILKHCFSCFRLCFTASNTLPRQKLRTLAQSFLPLSAKPVSREGEDEVEELDQVEDNLSGTPVSPKPSVGSNPQTAAAAEAIRSIAVANAASRVPLTRADVLKRCEAAGIQMVSPQTTTRGKSGRGSAANTKRKGKPARSETSGVTGERNTLAEQAIALDAYYTTIDTRNEQMNLRTVANPPAQVVGTGSTTRRNTIRVESTSDWNVEDIDYEITEEMFRSAFFDMATHNGEFSGVFAKPFLEAAATFLQPPFAVAPVVPLRWALGTVPIPHTNTCIHSADAPLLRLVEMTGEDPNVVVAQSSPKKGKRGKSAKGKASTSKKR